MTLRPCAPAFLASHDRDVGRSREAQARSLKADRSLSLSLALSLSVHGMKLPHLKDERGKDQYDRVQVTSASGDGPAGFSASSGVLSPRRRAAEAARRAAAAIGGGGGGLTDAQVSLSPAPSAFDDSRSFDAEAGDTPRADADEDADGDIDVDDLRFRVNGIVVDREMKGGAKPNWEYVYQILFQSSTPAGQRVALVLLVMVSLSVIIGASRRSIGRSVWRSSH